VVIDDILLVESIFVFFLFPESARDCDMSLQVGEVIRHSGMSWTGMAASAVVFEVLGGMWGHWQQLLTVMTAVLTVMAGVW
jgi:hypothetical protein